MESITKYLSPELLMNYAVQYGGSLIGAIAVFIIGKWLAKLVTKLVTKAMERSDMDSTISKFLSSIVYGVLFAFVIIATMGQLGIETTSLAAIFAAAGLAVGMALQGSLGNLASGVMLIAFRPFKAGDFVEIAGESGVVDNISIFTTTLNTPDNKVVVIPNGGVTSGNIVNYSAQDTRRIDLVFGIGYDDDIKRAKEVLHEIMNNNELVLQDPAPTVGVLELADSSVNFAVRPWVKSADYWNAHFAITEEVKTRFDAEGLSIPFPQQDVYMHQVDSEIKQAA